MTNLQLIHYIANSYFIAYIIVSISSLIVMRSEGYKRSEEVRIRRGYYKRGYWQYLLLTLFILSIYLR